MNLVDRAREVGADGNAVNGFHRANDAHGCGPLLLVGNNARNRRRRHLEMGGCLNCGLDLLEFYEAQAGHQD